MSRAVVFVHGTGVRGDAYARSFARIKAALPGDVSFSGCFWGESEGARLAADGASVPGYPLTGGGADVEEELALWAVLYTDPWYELRLLRLVDGRAGHVPPGTLPPAEVLREQCKGFQPSDELCAKLDREGLGTAFGDALDALVAAPEFDEAAATAAPDLVEHRKAVARAVIARTLVAKAAEVDGETRDALVELFLDELHGYGKGIWA
ncbi:MAG TPA: hypothetical protein VGL02_10610, partial [Streptomyces sp.]